MQSGLLERLHALIPSSYSLHTHTREILDTFYATPLVLTMNSTRPGHQLQPLQVHAATGLSLDTAKYRLGTYLQQLVVQCVQEGQPVLIQVFQLICLAGCMLVR